MSFPDICPACGRLTDKPHYDGCDADKAALFNWLAVQEYVEVIRGATGLQLYISKRGQPNKSFRGATLAEAVEKAMRAEGEAR